VHRLQVSRADQPNGESSVTTSELGNVDVD